MPVVSVMGVLMVMFVLVFLVLIAGGHGNVSVDGRYAVLLDLADREVKAQAKPLELGDHGFFIDSKVEEQPEEHVTGYAGEGVQIQYSAVCALHWVSPCH